MENFKEKLRSALIKSKRGQMGSASRVVGIVVSIVLIASLAPTIFGTDGLTNTDFLADAPTWLPTVLTIGAGVALVKLVIN